MSVFGPPAMPEGTMHVAERGRKSKKDRRALREVPTPEMEHAAALDLLGLRGQAPTPDSIRAAFARCVKRYHPDTAAQAYSNMMEHGTPEATLPLIETLQKARDLLLAHDTELQSTRGRGRMPSSRRGTV